MNLPVDPGVPFVLILGRKAGAKGYRKIIEAVEELNCEGVKLSVVLIGPDDDGVPINSANAIYLGRQPRNVVRGALQECILLCNMSTSESFGIVLLESWLAGKPVIVNGNCAAFRDMVVHGENGFVVSGDTLKSALVELANDPAARAELARNGRQVAEKFDWEAVCNNFVKICREMVAMEGAV